MLRQLRQHANCLRALEMAVVWCSYAVLDRSSEHGIECDRSLVIYMVIGPFLFLNISITRNATIKHHSAKEAEFHRLLFDTGMTRFTSLLTTLHNVKVHAAGKTILCLRPTVFSQRRLVGQRHIDLTLDLITAKASIL